MNLNLAWLINVYSRAAGIARMVIVNLSALVGILASGPFGHSTLTLQILVVLNAVIALLTRATGLGNKPPTLAPDAAPPV